MKNTAVHGPPRRRGCLRDLLMGAILMVVIVPATEAQSRRTTLDAAGVGSEAERYLRVLQLLGEVPLHPWSVRSLGPSALRRLTPANPELPWAHRPHLWSSGDTARFRPLQPELRAVANSHFAFGHNDGPAWMGRGFTGVASAGLAVRGGPLAAIISPTAFVTQNARFHLADNGQHGGSAFADLLYPSWIDQPRRFGDAAYARFDPGETTLRFDAGGLSIGASSAAQFWGPAFEHPLILGNNAGGFPHVLLGTERPVSIAIGTVHGRLVWGRLDHSPYAFDRATLRHRFMSGFVATFIPRGVPGLEIGAARFFHTAWPEDGLTADHFLKPFEGLLKSRLKDDLGPDRSDPDNQLASIFGRWAFPSSGFEFFVEFAREDHSWDARDFWMEPDHDAALAIGLQRAWARKDVIYAGRAELVNSRLSHLQQGRSQEPFYVHTVNRQGHTSAGQVLGSPGVFGGGAAVLAVDRFDRRGRLTLAWSRLMHAERRSADGFAQPRDASVSHSLSLDGFREAAGLDVIGGLTVTRHFNREFTRDAFNLQIVAGARGRW